MNILELDSYNLADAVKFNDELNPRLWQGNKMRPQVRAKLLEIAEDFKQSLGLTDLNVKDITLSGSNASYTYTPHSDIDLHLVVDLPEADASEVYRELFDAKKFQYNETHNIKIGGYDVELYVENANEPPVSQGMFSVLNNDWINIPLKKRSTVNDTAVKSKYDVMKHRIESAIKSGNLKRLTNTTAKIKKMRQAGLAKHGELGPENIAYKMLRSQGVIQKLYDARIAAKDRELSLRERTVQVKKPFRYGFKTTTDEDVGASWDGVNPTTQMFLNEEPKSDEDILKDFVEFCVAELKIEQMPHIRLRKDPQWPVVHKTFGRYVDAKKTLEVAWGQRHIMDVLRTVAHELTHKHQHERDGKRMGPDAGETGSPYENEANARAGVLMRDYARLHPEYFSAGQAHELTGLGEASGYIPTKKQARDPRFVMALTKDIRPGATGREANKLKLHTDSQGHPDLLITGLANALREFKETGRAPSKSYGYGSTPLTQVPGEIEDELGNQEATGPEFPPQMPAGTTKIDVSDLTDWYRLGMDISDMDDADPEDYGKGPPQTVIVFPSDEAEQGYLKQFKRLGLKTHDMDPDVKGGEDIYGKHQRDLDEEFELLEQEFLGEIKMSPTNLRSEAAKTGAMAGMEFEMIVPNADVDEEPNYEPDYDQDTRTRSFSDIVNFFYDGDYNGRRDVVRLEEALQEQFEEWREEQIFENWQDDGIDYLRDYIENNDYFDEEEATEEATNALQAEYGDDISPEDFQKMLDAIVKEKFDEFVQDQWDNQGRYYDDALEQFRDEQRQDIYESDWLQEHYPYMTDIQNNFDIAWPYYIDVNEGDGDMDIESVADDFSRAVGMKVNWSSSYHGGRREPDAYVVEPDGSLEPNDSNDGGLEFVSPPMPIDKMIDQLNKVKAWAGDYGCYTNRSTGLHINISVPDYDLDKLDYVKLALLLGDKYILDQYGRSSNTYAKSALGKVQDLIKRDPSKGKELLDKMRGHMEDLATKSIHSGSTDKYTSINTKSGYIEFRSPGGDWLDANFDKIENTLLRFTVALSAAMDPQAYREEYLKKLYKLLEPVAEEAKGLFGKGAKDTVKYFADYVAGKTPKAALRSFVKQAQLERRLKRDPTSGQPYWWRVSNPGQSYGEIEVVATTREEAIEKALAPDGYPSWANTRQSIQAVPVRPYDASPLKATVGEPEAIGQRSGSTAGGRPSNPEGRWVITPENDRQTVVYRFNAAGFDDANVVRRQWAQEHPGVWIVQRDDNQTLGQPSGSSRNALSQTDIENRLGWPDQTGDANYEVVDRSTQRPVFVFVANTDQDAQRKYSQFLDVMMLPHDTENYGYREIVVPGSTIDLQRQRAAQQQQQQQQPAPGPLGAGRELVGWEIRIDGQPVHTLSGIGNNQGDANRLAQQWILRQGSSFLRQHQGGEVEVVPAWREA